MSKTLVVKRTKELQGTVDAPASKSYTHRAIIIGSMGRRARILNPLRSDDTESTVKAWRSLGAGIKVKGNWKEIEIRGFGGKPKPGTNRINVGESGTLLRFMFPVVCLAKGTFIIAGKGTLRNRPSRSAVSALRQMGADISSGKDFCVPFKIKATGILNGGRIHIDPKETSQIVSALLITAPLLSRGTELITGKDLVSKPYVDITIDALKWAGIKIRETGNGYAIKPCQEFKPKGAFTVPGDYSSAAFILAAACLVKSNITIRNLLEDRQGDRAIAGILEKMGAKIIRKGSALVIKGPFRLKGITVGCRSFPDLVPVLTVLGCFAAGSMKITGIAHLAHKESNRLFSVAEQLNKLGAKIIVNSARGSITIARPLPNNLGKIIFPSVQTDHRVAMALALVGLKAGSVTIKGSECISKSYPGFARDLRALGARIAQKEL